MGEQKDKTIIDKGSWPFIIIVLLFLGYYGYKEFSLYLALQNNGRYTVGEICRMDTVASKSGNEYNFTVKYTVEDTKYEQSATLGLGHPKYSIGDSMFVHFLPKEPGRAMLFIKNPPPANIRQVPPKGWKELPKGAQGE